MSRRFFCTLGELVLAQHAIVYEDAGELIAHGAMHQFGRDRGIDTTRKSADHAARADGLANVGDGFVDEALRRPVRLQAANLEDEIAQDLGAMRGVMYFGMKLHCVIFLRGILDGGDGVRGLGDQLEAGREFIGLVAVRHPDRQRPLRGP